MKKLANIVPINRKKLFSKYEEVCLNRNATEERVLTCFECKLNAGGDLVLKDQSLEGEIAHWEAHKRAQHEFFNFRLNNLQLEKNIKDNSVACFDLHYAISNNGDGSASVHFYKTAKEAAEFDERQDEGWAESCDGTKKLHFDSEGLLINADVIDEEDY